MNKGRTKNATRNAFFAVVLKVYQIIIPFLMRTAMIYFMGVKYLGLNSLFSSVLQVLNLAELGIGSAMVYSMYKPVAEKDVDRVCALMNMYRTYYRIIGIIIAVIGGCITPFVSYLIKGSVPGELNIYILYLLELSSTVLSYWLFAYRNCLFYAHQRDDINSKINICANTILYCVQLFILVFVRLYYAYVIAAVLATILRNIVTGYLSYKTFPQYVPRGKLSKNETSSINKKIRDLFTAKLGMVIVGSADTIVISAFLGLETLALYQNYFFIMSSIMGILTAVYTSCTAGIGNSLILESKEKNFNDLKRLAFLIGWVSTFCSICFLCLYQPFMTIWMGESRMLPFEIIVCLVAYFFVSEVNQLLNLYKDAGGLWSKDKFRPLVTSLANLCMNLIMVQFWGLYGVILSTVLSMLIIGMPWLFYNLFTELFEPDHLLPFLKIIGSFVVSLFFAAICSLSICSLVRFDGLFGLAIKLVVCIVVPNIILFVIYRKTDGFSQALELVNKITNGKILSLMKKREKLSLNCNKN